MRHIKCVLVGDSSSGKSEMINAYLQQKYPTSYRPQKYDNYALVVQLNGEDYSLDVFDTPDFDDCLRVLSYPNTDVFLVCFNVADSVSRESVRTEWLAEIVGYFEAETKPTPPCLLVGTQIDLLSEWTSENGRMMAREIGAVKYIGCSAKTRVRSFRLIYDSTIFLILVFIY